ncbi:methyltransferase, partial [Acinetobacter baumannii]|nr:methyltransferase [Acinetobacter baumannii]
MGKRHMQQQWSAVDNYLIKALI